jgi:hypothetical protein
MAKKKTTTAITFPSNELMIDTDQIPDTIPGVVDLIQSLMSEARRTSLVYVWNVGKIIRHIQDKDGWGSGAVEQVAEKMGQTPRLLWEMLRFYNYHEDFDHVKVLAIEWSASRLINQLKDPKVRKKLEDKAAKENMTVTEVKEEVRKIKTQDAPKDKKPTTKKGPNALQYFMLLDQQLATTIADLDKQLGNLSDMLELTSDEKRTPDESYALIVEGSGKNAPLVQTISRKAVSIVERLNRVLVPLENTFREGGQPTDS